MFQLMSPVCYFWKRAKTSVLKLFVSHIFVYIVYNISVFVQWGGWEGMNKPDLQLNLYDLISWSCWDTLVYFMWVCNFFLERVTRE